MQQDPDSTNQFIEQRRMLSSALLVRFVLVIVGVVVLAVLPWPYPFWVKIPPVAIWALQGIIAARALRRAATGDDVRRISRWLLVVDASVSAIVTYLYMPLYHDVWAFMLVLIVFGSTQDRRVAPLALGALITALILGAWLVPATPPVESVRGSTIAVDLTVVWMVAIGMELFMRSLWSRSQSLAAESAQMKDLAAGQAALREASEAQAGRMARVIELSVTLMRERELGPLLDRILDATMQTFGFRCGAIMTSERDREVFAYRAVRGYPPDQLRRLMIREVPFAQASLKLEQRFQIKPSVFYAPVERQSWHTDPLTCFRPEHAMLPRERRNAWHEADTLVFTLTSSTGEIIGLLCPDAPVDEQVPSMETIDNVAMFARLAAAAIENVYLASIEPHREAAERVAKTLDLTAAIFTERDLDSL